MTFVRKRRVTHKPKDIVAQEPMAERETARDAQRDNLVCITVTLMK
jgi:hypothetical protein